MKNFILDPSGGEWKVSEGMGADGEDTHLFFLFSPLIELTERFVVSIF